MTTTLASAYAFLERPQHMPRGSLAGHVTRTLREAIVSLRLKPGTMLDKSEICARLGVSRSPVAEALARLQAEGLIDILPQRGSVVSLVSIAAIREYIFIRKALEGEAARHLARHPPEGLIAALNANLDGQRRMAEAGDMRGFHRLDVEFHALLLDASGYRRMKAIVETARSNLDRARHLTNNLRLLPVVVEEHRAILDTIVQGDGERAARTMHAHLDTMVTSVLAVARESPGLFSDGERAVRRQRAG